MEPGKAPWLNDAYRTLKDPIKRTEYLFALEGVELEEQSKQATERLAPRRTEETGPVPPDSGRSLRAEHAPGKSCGPETLGEDDPAVTRGNRQGQAVAGRKFDALFNELKIDSYYVRA